MSSRKEKSSGVYRIINLKNNKSYIGSSGNIYRRKQEHFRELGRNKHHNEHLQKAYNKYGKEYFIFEILERNIPNKDLCTKEREYIIKFDTINRNKGYNLDLPTSENYTKNRSEETKEKLRRISLAYIGIDSEEKYNKWKEEQIIKKATPKLGLKKRIVVLDRFTKEYINTYNSIAEATRETNSIEKKVSAVVNKQKYIKSHNGYIFLLEDEYKKNILNQIRPGYSKGN